MNRVVSPEMLQMHCLNSPGGHSGAGNCTDMTVLERQRARIHTQQQSNYFNGNELNGLFYNPFESQSGQAPGFLGMMIGAMKPDPDLDNGFDLPGVGYAELVAGGLARTTSCPMTAAPVISDVKARVVGFSPEKIGSVAGRESPKKRKADRVQMTKIAQDDIKRSKGSSEESDSKITDQNNAKISNNNRETSGDTSKENSKASEVQKPDYIHVRARRGQATDSHSLAERVRREKISERMKYLQDLVPGCNKITGKAGMLDEIINYVQSLQRQVEFLSMKLAAVNPRLDFNIEDLFAKEIFPTCTAGIQTLGISEAEMSNPAFNLQFNPACIGLEMGLTSQDLTLRRTISAPVSVLDQPYIDASSYNQQIQPQLPAWDSELQNVYNVFSSQPFSGSIEACNLKMEM